MQEVTISVGVQCKAQIPSPWVAHLLYLWKWQKHVVELMFEGVVYEDRSYVGSDAL